jgi:DNA-binding GntR family transcriptional regulator
MSTMALLLTCKRGTAPYIRNLTLHHFKRMRTVPIISDDTIDAREKVADRLAKRLRHGIVSGELRAGESLGLVSLAESLGVSTTPVREALQLLASEGLVIGGAHRGYRVAHLDETGVRDLFAVQAFISGVLTERAAQRMSAEELEELAVIQAAIEEAVKGDHIERVNELNLKFHTYVFRAARSETLFRAMSSTFELAVNRTTSNVPRWRDLSLRDHTRILEALRAGDGARARKMAEEHTRNAGELVIEELARNDVLAPGV